MKYTRYFSTNVKAQGLPNFSQYGFSTMMNIVHLEGRIEGLKRMQRMERRPEDVKKYDLLIRDYETKIEEIALKMEPEELVRTFIEMKF